MPPGEKRHRHIQAFRQSAVSACLCVGSSWPSNRPELDVLRFHLEQDIGLELVVTLEGVIEADDLNWLRIARHRGSERLNVDWRFEADDQVPVGDRKHGLGCDGDWLDAGRERVAR